MQAKAALKRERQANEDVIKRLSNAEASRLTWTVLGALAALLVGVGITIRAYKDYAIRNAVEAADRTGTRDTSEPNEAGAARGGTSTGNRARL